MLYLNNHDYNLINDKSTFKEKYLLNYWTLPLLMHYDMGKSRKWGMDMGFTFARYSSGYRHHVLLRKVSGKDAYEDGFQENERTKQKLEKSIIKKGSTGLAFGLNYRLSNKSLIRLYAERTPKVFTNGRNFSSLTTHLQYSFTF